MDGVHCFFPIFRLYALSLGSLRANAPDKEHPFRLTILTIPAGRVGTEESRTAAIIFVKISDVADNAFGSAPVIGLDVKSNFDSKPLGGLQEQWNNLIFSGTLTPPGSDDHA